MKTKKSFGAILVAVIATLVISLAYTSCGGDGKRGRKTKEKEKVDQEQVEETAETTASAKSATDYSHMSPLDFKLYMESSGSMYAYTNPNTKGELKKTVSDMMNRIPDLSSDSNIYVVNDNIYKVDKGIKDFIAERDFMAGVKGIGNASYTDFQKIFTVIQEDLNKNDVAILFSDMIYSVKDQGNVNSQQLINEAEAMTRAVFRTHPDVDVLVIKFEADYNGKYYPYDSPNKGQQYVGERPIYAMIFAKQGAMQQLLEDPRYAEFRKFSSIPNYEDMFVFTRRVYEPEYMVMTSDYGKKGKFKKGREKGGKGLGAHSIQDVELSKSGELVIPIAIDLSAIPMTGNYKLDPDNYEVISKADYEVEDIQPVDINDKNVGNATHIITIATDEKPKNETIQIRMKNSMPRWISKSNSNDDRNLSDEKFPETTFAFGAMMDGIHKTYAPAEETVYLFNVPLEIKK